MALSAEGRSCTTVNSLIETIDRYMSDNRHARDVNERWLCSLLTPVLDTARQVRNSRLEAENKLAVNAFRAAEIEAELQNKRRETEALERDLKKLLTPQPS